MFDPRDGTLFVETVDVPQIGSQVRVDLSIGDEGPRVIFRGRVVASRTQPDGGMPAGCSVALGPQEREKVDYMQGFYRGGLLNLREKRRLPLRLAVTFHDPSGGACRSYTRDINEEGVFIVSEDPFPEDTVLDMQIQLPNGENVPLTGVVKHTVVIEDEDVPGMGVVFDLNDQKRAIFVKQIDALEAAFLRGELPDETLI